MTSTQNRGRTHPCTTKGCMQPPPHMTLPAHHSTSATCGWALLPSAAPNAPDTLPLFSRPSLTAQLRSWCSHTTQWVGIGTELLGGGALWR